MVMETIVKEPIIGNMQNSFDNTITKNIEILDDEGVVENTLVATEWFAEVAYSGHWRVSQAWIQQSEQAAIITLNKAKSAAAETINQWRLRVNQTSFPFDGKQIACDALSRSDLDGMAHYVNLFADFPVGFSMQWKTVDNTYIPFKDTQDFKDMYAAMVETGNDNFVKAQHLKQRVNEAKSHSELEAILGELDG